MRSRSKERRGRPAAGRRVATPARTLGGERVRLVRRDLVYNRNCWHNICSKEKITRHYFLAESFGKLNPKCKKKKRKKSIFNLEGLFKALLILLIFFLVEYGTIGGIFE